MDLEKDKIYIVGNWKMNPLTLDDAETIFDEVENDVYKINNDRVEVVVCPPCLFLSEFDNNGKVKLGAQNVFWESRGAFTGEVSAEMLRKIGAKYVIVGHSERRKYLGETDEMINLKVKASLQSKMRPILCVGENLEEKRRGDAGEIIVSQIEKALEEIPEEDIRDRLIVAYEPIWAIGSGLVPSLDEIMSTGLLVRKVLAKIYGNRDIADNTPVLYGGSVSCQNCFDLVDKTGMNGLLVGGASLRASEFVGIIKSFAK